MEHVKEAVKLSVERGYPATHFKYDSIFLDPLFWEALGKSLGWEKKTVRGKLCGIEGCTGKHLEGTDWKDQMHRFVDALSEGQTPDEFFKELLVDKK